MPDHQFLNNDELLRLTGISRNGLLDLRNGSLPREQVRESRRAGRWPMVTFLVTGGLILATGFLDIYSDDEAFVPWLIGAFLVGCGVTIAGMMLFLKPRPVREVRGTAQVIAVSVGRNQHWPGLSVAGEQLAVSQRANPAIEAWQRAIDPTAVYRVYVIDFWQTTSVVSLERA